MLQNMADILNYMDGEKLECLECGKWFKGLGVHVVQAHDMTAADYKQKHGIPMKIGLLGMESRQKKADHAKAMHAAGIFTIKSAHTKKPDASKARKKQPYHQAYFFQRGFETKQERAYPPEVYEEYLRRLQDVRSLECVSSDSDMPCVALIYRHAKTDAEYAARLKAITKQNKSTLIKRLRAVEKLKRSPKNQR